MSDPYRRDTDVDPDLLAAYTRGVLRARRTYAADHPTDEDQRLANVARVRRQRARKENR